MSVLLQEVGHRRSSSFLIKFYENHHEMCKGNCGSRKRDRFQLGMFDAI